MTTKKESWLKVKLSTIFKSPFSHRGKKVAVDGSDGLQTSSSYEGDLSTPHIPAGVVAPFNTRADTDATSTTRGSRSSFDANASQSGPVATMGGRELGSIDGRCLSPAPSQARSYRQSISKAASASRENVRVSITVDTIKQQLNDGLQILAEFKKSLRPSSDVQRYDEAIGTFEGAAKGLATLKGKSSNRKLAGSANSANRNSYVLPPPDLKVEFEDTPFSMGIPGIEESQKESTLDVVQESNEKEAQEEAKEKKNQPQLQCVWN